MIPHLVEVWEEYEPKGLALLTISSEDSKTVTGHMETHGMTYPTAAGGRSSQDYGVSGIPAAFLIDHTGTIIWQGNPGVGGWQDLMDDALERADVMSGKWDLGERPAFMKKAAGLAMKGQMGKLWKETEVLATKFALEEDKLAAIQQLQADFQVRSNAHENIVADYVVSGRYQEASDHLSGQIKIYKGSPIALEWEAKLKSWKKDAEIKDLIKLDKKRLAAIAMANQGKADKAKKAMHKLLRDAKGTRLEKSMDLAYAMISAMK